MRCLLSSMVWVLKYYLNELQIQRINNKLCLSIVWFTHVLPASYPKGRPILAHSAIMYSKYVCADVAVTFTHVQQAACPDPMCCQFFSKHQRILRYTTKVWWFTRMHAISSTHEPQIPLLHCVVTLWQNVHVWTKLKMQKKKPGWTENCHNEARLERELSFSMITKLGYIQTCNWK